MKLLPWVDHLNNIGVYRNESCLFCVGNDTHVFSSLCYNTFGGNFSITTKWNPNKLQQIYLENYTDLELLTLKHLTN